jgi:hypothetical protein
VVFIPIRLRNQIWDKYHFSGTQLWHERRAEGREFIMPPRRTGFNEYMPQGQRTYDLEHERLLRAGWAVHAGVGLFNQKGNTLMYGNLTAGGFFDWMGREQLGAGRVMARTGYPVDMNMNMNMNIGSGLLPRWSGACPALVSRLKV